MPSSERTPVLLPFAFSSSEHQVIGQVISPAFRRICASGNLATAHAAVLQKSYGAGGLTPIFTGKLFSFSLRLAASSPVALWSLKCSMTLSLTLLIWIKGGLIICPQATMDNRQAAPRVSREETG
jgi:hypothetical protein